jgi:membrane protein
MLAFFECAIGWRELVKRTYRDMMEDAGLGLAAQLAYYFFLSLFPAILCVVAIASFLPLQTFTDDMVRLLGPFAPAEVLAIIREQMVRIAEGNDGGLVSLGLIGALWSSSSAMVAVIDAMNRAYDIEEGRPWWKVRSTAVLMTIGLSCFVVLSFGLILAGPEVASALASRFSLGEVFVWTWNVLQWPLALALVGTGIGLVYYFAPDAEQEWAWVTPGSLVAAILWVVGSLAFRFYVVNVGSYEATYGAIGGVILLLLWFYLSGVVIVLGAELSAEIERAAPWSRNPPLGRDGQRKIGAAASRACRERGPGTPLVRSPFHAR